MLLGQNYVERVLEQELRKQVCFWETVGNERSSLQNHTPDGMAKRKMNHENEVARFHFQTFRAFACHFLIRDRSVSVQRKTISGRSCTLDSTIVFVSVATKQ